MRAHILAYELPPMHTLHVDHMRARDVLPEELLKLLSSPSILLFDGHPETLRKGERIRVACGLVLPLLGWWRDFGGVLRRNNAAKHQALDGGTQRGLHTGSVVRLPIRVHRSGTVTTTSSSSPFAVAVTVAIVLFDVLQLRNSVGELLGERLLLCFKPQNAFVQLLQSTWRKTNDLVFALQLVLRLTPDGEFG